MRRAYRRDTICATQRFQEQRFVNSPKMSVKPTKAMVLAAGLGVRMRPLTDRMPKPLVRVAGRALLDHVLDKLGDAGVTEAVVNVHYLPDQIIEHTAARKRPRVIISDERDDVLGTGGGVVKALPLLGDAPFFHVNADTLWIDGVRPNLARLAETFEPSRMDILLLMAPTTSSIGYSGRGDYAMQSDGALRKRREHQVVPFVYAGAAIMSPSLFADAPTGEFSLTKMFDRANERERLFGLRMDGVWMHVGTPDAIHAAEEAFLASVA
jgi:N-acetyl-alpha-D-muramate 1-phosphate uridylyltransferase